jgi:hypothetical protein
VGRLPRSPYREYETDASVELGRHVGRELFRAATCALALGLGFVATPAVVVALAHAVVPELFAAVGLLAGGSLALLFLAVAAADADR